MALNWNQIQARKSARTNLLADKPIDSSEPNTTTNLGAVSKIEDAVEEIPEWRIEGVSPVKIDVVTGKEPPVPEPAPIWPSKTRPQTFTAKYQDLDPLLDGNFISVEGLAEVDPGEWTAEPI